MQGSRPRLDPGFYEKTPIPPFVCRFNLIGGVTSSMIYPSTDLSIRCRHFLLRHRGASMLSLPNPMFTKTIKPRLPRSPFVCDPGTRSNLDFGFSNTSPTSLRSFLRFLPPEGALVREFFFSPLSAFAREFPRPSAARSSSWTRCTLTLGLAS